MKTLWLTIVTFAVPALVLAQQDPVVGNWRGTVKSTTGAETTIVLTIAKNGDRYFGSTTGLSEGADVPFTKLEVNGTQATFESAAESRLGAVMLTGTLMVDGNRVMGEGQVGVGAQRFPITFTLQRRMRADVVQHQVEQSAAYFAGRWKFDYIGGEFPPLSIGNRQGEVTFARAGASSFVSGVLKGESYGTAFEERIFIGVDADTDTLVMAERHGDGTEILSVGNWKSPLAIVFQTSPVVTNGKTYQLRRTYSILSETAFNVAEEFSVDGGPFRRLGAGHFTKQ
jgi:hypothetical protein